LEYLDQDALKSENIGLLKELVQTCKQGPDKKVQIGIPLLSDKINCTRCGSKLYTRSDCVVSATLYNDDIGSIPAVHYSKYCRKKDCSFQQHYGYHTLGDGSEIHYDKDALLLPYLMSSRETGCSLKLLDYFNSEILIGQISYGQKADIYNHYHNYKRITQR